jgi:protein with PEP-CTERM/exosortase system signal
MKSARIVIKTLAALAVAFAVGNMAKADPITGSISFTGTPTFINGNTAVEFSDAYVSEVPTGSFAPIGAFAGWAGAPILSPDTVTFHTIIFDPLTIPSGNLWTVTVPGGDTYSIQATSIVFTSPPSYAEWDFAGKGLISITGPVGDYTPTMGSWGITFSQNGQLSFEATTGVGVPDGGTTALLVGMGLLGVGFYARRSRLSKS